MENMSPRTRRAVNILLKRVENRKGARIRTTFVRRRNPDANAERPPLARLVSTKGKTSAVPLKLYLSLLLLNVKPPNQSHMTNRFWAEVLGLKKPDTTGARRVAAALAKLEEPDIHLVESIKRPGKSQYTEILSDDGTGMFYLPPKGDNGDTYFMVPKELWKGHIQGLNAAGLAMLLITMEESQWTGSWDNQYWSMKQFDERFGISRGVKSRGTKDHQEGPDHPWPGLIEVSRAPIDADEPFDPHGRFRNEYKVVGPAEYERDYFSQTPDEETRP